MSGPQAGTALPAKLDDLMLAMDVVDTLRHREDLVTRELNEADRETALIGRLREIYRQQGIEVPDRVLRDGVAALRESRFTYVPPPAGWRRNLALVWVRRGRYGKGLAAAFIVGGLAWAGWQIGFVRPEQARIAAAEEELSRALPNRMAALHGEIANLAQEPEVRTRAEALRAEGERALRARNAAEARAVIDGLEMLRDALAQEYVLTIVSRPRADTGIWRVPPRGTGRNYYLIVEPIAADGRKLTIPVRNEETGSIDNVDMFGVRVPQSTFEAVARDKRDDGIVQRNRLGEKKRGRLSVEYLMPAEGGFLTKW